MVLPPEIEELEVVTAAIVEFPMLVVTLLSEEEVELLELFPVAEAAELSVLVDIAAV